MMAAALLLLLLLVVSSCCGNDGPIVTLDPEDGHIVSYRQNGKEVLFRNDEFRGPAFEKSETDSLDRSVESTVENGHLVIRASIENKSSKPYVTKLRERLILGVDTKMLSFPQWDSVLFPTLIRCEKDFAWGYFSGTDGRILAFATEEPVASYGINYKYEGIKEWMWGHTIHTASLDLMHCGPLPQRHPQNLDTILPGQRLTWTIHMGMVDKLCNVKKALNEWAGVPMVELSAYTVEPGTLVKIRTFGKCNISVLSPSVKAVPIKNSILKVQEKGLYRIMCTSGDKTAEATLFVRPTWEWYAAAARETVAKYPPRMGNSCESFYGYLPAFLEAKLSPDRQLDSLIGATFERTVPAIIDTVTCIPYPVSLPERIQNFSTLAVAMARHYDAGADIRWLRYASRLADYIMERQDSTGAYRSLGTHYTAVIYPAKSLFDVAEIESRSGMVEEAGRHWNSAMMACLDLADRPDDIETEGDMTFEDGMITCSALQMAYAALHTDDKAIRARLTEAAEYMIRKHRCLEQDLIPDCRMRGATLRWWEALDIYFSPNQVMNSPHGWSAWKAYAVAYLYRLTGKEEYHRDLEDLLGSCAQLMDLNGNLRWGFMPDPYVDGRVCVPADKPYEWTTVDKVVGEQYMEMISTWCRPQDETKAASFGEFGGCGDCTVYEIFNAIEELCIPTEGR